MLDVWSDPYFAVRVDYRLKVVLLTRSRLAFRNVEEIKDSYARIDRELRAYASVERAIVLDSRLAPQLDPAFEADFLAANMAVFKPFRMCCVLLGTPTGLVQGRRMRSRLPTDRVLLITNSITECAAHVGAPGLVDLLR